MDNSDFQKQHEQQHNGGQGGSQGHWMGQNTYGNALNTNHLSSMNPDSNVKQQQQQGNAASSSTKNNVEKFLTLVGNYMHKIGKEFNPRPIVGNVTINLFAVYYLVSYMGGLEKVLAENKLQSIAQRVGINNKQHLNDFIHMYYAYLYPFEQYAKSQEGVRDFQQRMTAASPLQQQKMQQHQLQQVQQQREPLIQSPMQKNTPQMVPIQNVPMRTHSIPSTKPSISADMNKPIQLDISQNLVLDKDELKQSKTPQNIKVYHPLKFYQDRTNGLDLQQLDQLGEKLDDLKPVFLYFPELGKIDLKALSLALESGIDAEINNALNILLIVTTDQSTVLDLNLAPQLLDSLSKLGSQLVNRLLCDDLDRSIPHNQLNESLLSKLNTSKSTSISLIDEIFDKYTKNQPKGNDETIFVDSFSSKVVDKDGNVLVDDTLNAKGFETENDFQELKHIETPRVPNYKHYNLNYLLSRINEKSLNNFKLTPYIELLHKCKEQADRLVIDIDDTRYLPINDDVIKPNYDIHSKSYTSRRIMMMEELTTLSLIIRNLSFIGTNNVVMGTSNTFMDFISSEIIVGLIYDGEQFGLFERKRLMLLKDSLIVLTNTAHIIEFKSELNMWILLCLVFIFGPNISGVNPKLNLITSNSDPKLNKYYGHAIDILMKSICSSQNNLNFLKSILLGNINDIFVIKMINSIYKNEDIAFNKRQLWKDVFSLLISALPLSSIHQSIAPFNEKPHVILESLLGCLSLVDILIQDNNEKKSLIEKRDPAALNDGSDFNIEMTNNSALDILLSVENVGMILNHLCFMYACIFVNAPNNEKRNEHVHISARSIELVNKLILCSLNHAEISMSICNSNTIRKEIKQKLIKLSKVNRLFGSTDHMLGMLMTLEIPQTIVLQVIETIQLMHKLNKVTK